MALNEFKSALVWLRGNQAMYALILAALSVLL